jgi:hypothetical protein
MQVPFLHKMTFFKNYSTVLISYAFILLFVYAAVSKLLDFENFRVQLGQSPLLGAYAELTAWFIPLLEIYIAFALSFVKFRQVALFASYFLMVMFTAYIYIILNYSSFVPCSCGGVLEKMSWNEHLIFNIAFILLAVIGIFNDSQPHTNKKKTILTLLLLTVLGIGSVLVLFLMSENKMQYNNAFTRRIPHSPLKMLKGISLEHNSYYIAGYEDGKIYLGNHSAPKHVLQIDTSLAHQQAFRISQDNYQFLFSTAQVRIKDGNYYFADGTIPVIYRGSLADWKGKLIYNGATKFTTYEVIDSTLFSVRATHPKTGVQNLETINLHEQSYTKPFKDNLEKRWDGIFDTDGQLHYNSTLRTPVYTYFYRNDYLVANHFLDSIVKGKTIDSLEEVDLKFAFTNNGNEKKFSTQPEKINTYSCTSGKYLFIKSKRLSTYDSKKMFEQASIIDVYHLEKNSYEFSFYLYHYKGEEVKSFKVYKDIIVGITDHYLIVGRFRKERFNPLQ